MTSIPDYCNCTIDELCSYGFDEAANIVLQVENYMKQNFGDYDPHSLDIFFALYIDNLHALGFDFVSLQLKTHGFIEPDYDSFALDLREARNILLDAVMEATP